MADSILQKLKEMVSDTKKAHKKAETDLKGHKKNKAKEAKTAKASKKKTKRSAPKKR